MGILLFLLLGFDFYFMGVCVGCFVFLFVFFRESLAIGTVRLSPWAGGNGAGDFWWG